jgi:hypothetical protein
MIGGTAKGERKMEAKQFYEFLEEQDVEMLQKIIQEIVILIDRKEAQKFLESVKGVEVVR